MIKSGDWTATEVSECTRLIMRTQDWNMPVARSSDVHTGEYENHEHFRFCGF